MQGKTGNKVKPEACSARPGLHQSGKICGNREGQEKSSCRTGQSGQAGLTARKNRKSDESKTKPDQHNRCSSARPKQ